MKTKATKLNSYEIGILAEKKSIEYLKENAFSIIEQRYKSKFGEIDIIAKKNNCLAIIEVKYRKKNNFADGLSQALESINRRTRQRIENCLSDFLSKNTQYADFDIRFDIICITGEIDDFEISHIENAWWMGE